MSLTRIGFGFFKGHTPLVCAATGISLPMSRALSGAKPFEEFAKLINEELAKRNIAPPPGTPTS